MTFSLKYFHRNLTFIKYMRSAVCFLFNKQRQEKWLSAPSVVCQGNWVCPHQQIPTSLTFDHCQFTCPGWTNNSFFFLFSNFHLIQTLSTIILTDGLALLFRSKQGKSQESKEPLRPYQGMYFSQNAVHRTPHLPLLSLSQQTVRMISRNVFMQRT